MKFLILSHGSAETVPQHSEIRTSHREHLSSLGQKLLSSGAFTSEQGDEELGRAMLIEMDSEAEARAFAEADPFSIAGVTTHIEVFRWQLKWWEGRFLG